MSNTKTISSIIKMLAPSFIALQTDDDEIVVNLTSLDQFDTLAQKGAGAHISITVLVKLPLSPIYKLSSEKHVILVT